ncbi:2,4-dihydroxyhept-2-ene-1,7-dioic acid aldolase [Salmonella enterica subsp. arizonae]|uniref:2,4-dihydroxyhept-2-ene-1,7-dioic acid aldolase n=1 Tax=Salmonella enterica subsp. arizonae TaxID=59203 RepID=A0A379TFH5_SALER|nr:2,4-dihydroxyhept-2-ene-1,7-dioic acid aldolase [Salmonella enterica subsp. arizonae]
MKHWRNVIWNWGALFVAVGVDTTLLARGAEALAARFGAEKKLSGASGVY